MNFLPFRTISIGNLKKYNFIKLVITQDVWKKFPWLTTPRGRGISLLDFGMAVRTITKSEVFILTSLPILIPPKKSRRPPVWRQTGRAEAMGRMDPATKLKTDYKGGVLPRL